MPKGLIYMAYTDWSATAADNSFIGSVDIRAGQMDVANVDNALRELIAELAAFRNAIQAQLGTNFDGALLKAGGTMTGEIIRSGKGAYLFNDNSLHNKGNVYIRNMTDPNPMTADGQHLIRYS